MDSSDLVHLAALDALLQEGSVTGAARRLGLSTPAVSHALARLRERLGDPLLVRAGRGMVRTPRAETLAPKVRDALASAERVFEAPEVFEPRSLDRSFTLSLTDYVLAVLGPGLEASVRREAPALGLRFLLNVEDDAERLRRGESDVAVGVYPALPPELKTRKLLRERLVCVVRADHPTAAHRLGIDTYLRLAHVQVAPRGRPGGYVDAVLARRGLARRVARAVPFFQLALEMVARSDDVLTVPERLARARAPALGLVVHEPPIPLEPYALHAVWHPRNDGDPAHRWLRSLLFDAAAAVDRSPPPPRRAPATARGRRRAR